MPGHPTPSAPRLNRRAALAGFGAMGIALSLLPSGPAVSAQQATPGPLQPALAEWIAGWQARDPDRIAAIYAEDGVHEVIATGETLTGRDAIRANIAALIGAIPDAALAVNQAFSTGDAGAIDWTFTGHYTNQLPGFPPPARQALAFRAATLFTLSGGLVARTTEFYDFYGLLVQVGALPAPAGATPGA